MTQDATSAPSENTASATEDDTAQVEQTLTNAANADDSKNNSTADSGSEDNSKPAKGNEQLGDGGKRALNSERQARRDAEKKLTDMASRLQQYEDRDKTELQKALERAEAAEKGVSSMRVANARLMAAAVHNLPPDLIDLLGGGTDEEIDARAKLLAEKLAAAAPPPAPVKEPAPARTRPVESLTPGGTPANKGAEDMDAVLRAMAGRT